MDIKVKYSCKEIDWKLVAATLKKVEMGYHEPQVHRKAFENSYVTIFLYCDNRMIGFGRAISDGAYQAGIYDVAVDPEFQKKGLGNMIIEMILKKIPECNVILYASPGKEGFYIKNGFRRMKTGMALFTNAQKMSKKGFTD